MRESFIYATLLNQFPTALLKKQKLHKYTQLLHQCACIELHAQITMYSHKCTCSIVSVSENVMWALANLNSIVYLAHLPTRPLTHKLYAHQQRSRKG